MPLHGCVGKRGRVSFLPGMAVFKPFSGPFGSGWYNLSFLPKKAVKSKIMEKLRLFGNPGQPKTII